MPIVHLFVGLTSEGIPCHMGVFRFFFFYSAIRLIKEAYNYKMATKLISKKLATKLISKKVFQTRKYM